MIHILVHSKGKSVGEKGLEDFFFCFFIFIKWVKKCYWLHICISTFHDLKTYNALPVKLFYLNSSCCDKALNC